MLLALYFDIFYGPTPTYDVMSISFQSLIPTAPTSIYIKQFSGFEFALKELLPLTKRIIKYITDRCICELWPVRGVINFISLDKKGSMIAVRIGVVLVGGCNSLVLLDGSPPISRGLARISWDAKGVTGSWYGVWYWVAFPKRKGLTFYVLIFFRGNINMYLYFMSLLHIDMT